MTRAELAAAAIRDDAANARRIVKDALRHPAGDNTVGELRKALRRADRALMNITTRTRMIAHRARRKGAQA